MAPPSHSPSPPRTRAVRPRNFSSDICGINEANKHVPPLLALVELRSGTAHSDLRSAAMQRTSPSVSISFSQRGGHFTKLAARAERLRWSQKKNPASSLERILGISYTGCFQRSNAAVCFAVNSANSRLDCLKKRISANTAVKDDASGDKRWSCGGSAYKQAVSAISTWVIVGIRTSISRWVSEEQYCSPYDG